LGIIFPGRQAQMTADMMNALYYKKVIGNRVAYHDACL